KEEEQLLVGRSGDLGQPDPATQVASKLVEAKRRHRPALQVVEERVGLQGIVAQELVGGAVKSGAAALGYGGNQDARVAAVFGIEYAGLEFEFGDGVHAELRVLAVIGADIG